MHFDLWVRALGHLTATRGGKACSALRPRWKVPDKTALTGEQLKLFSEECLFPLSDVLPALHGQRLCFLFRNPSLTWWGLPFAYWHPVPTDCRQNARRPFPGTAARPRTSSWSHSRSSSVRTTSPRPPNSWSPSPPKRTTTEQRSWPLCFLGFSQPRYKCRCGTPDFYQKQTCNESLKLFWKRLSIIFACFLTNFQLLI